MPDDILENIESLNSSKQTRSMMPTSSPEKPKTAAEHRKSSKPIMEKRRRARINNSLCQLKTLILDALKKDSSRHSKLEKADILEMTVKHLRNVQMTAPHLPALGKYRAGYSACMSEVARFASTCDGVNGELRSRLLAHLATRLPQVSVAMMTSSQPPPLPPPPPPSLQRHAPATRDTAFKPGAIHVLPTATGTLALFLPAATAAAAVPGIVTGNGGDHAAPCPSARDSVWRPW